MLDQYARFGSEQHSTLTDAERNLHRRYQPLLGSLIWRERLSHRGHVGISLCVIGTVLLALPSFLEALRGQ